MDFRPYVTLSVPSRAFRDLANPLAAVEVQELQGAAFDCDTEISPRFDLTADLHGNDRPTVGSNPTPPHISPVLSDRGW